MKKTKQAKKLFTMLLVLTMLVSGIPVFTSVSTQDSIIEVLPYTDFSTDITAIADGGLWLKAGSDKVEEGMLKVMPSGTGAGGGSYVFDNLGGSFAEADHSSINDTFPAWRTYKHVFKTQVTLLQNGSAADALSSIVATKSDQSNVVNSNALAATYLVLQQGETEGTYRIKLNTTADPDPLRSKLDQYTTPDGYDSIPLGKKVSVAIVIYSNAEETNDFCDFYLDGQYFGTTSPYNNSTYRLSKGRMLRFRTSNGTSDDGNGGYQSKIIAGFDNMAHYAMPVTMTPIWTIENVAKSAVGHQIVFGGEVTGEIRKTITIDGESVPEADVEILEDQRSVLVKNIGGMTFTVGIKADVPNMYGAVSTGTETFFYDGRGTVHPMLSFTDFNDGEIPEALQGTSFSVSNGVLTGKASNTGMSSRYVELPEAVKTAIQTDSGEWHLFIMGKTSIAPDAETNAEFGLISGTTTYRRLIGHHYDDTNGYQARYNNNGVNGVLAGVAAQISETEAQGWLDWVVVLNGNGETAEAVYYCNGKELTRQSITDLYTDTASAQRVRFSLQGSDEHTVSGSFDDLAIYAVTDGLASLTGTVNADTIAINERIKVTFTSPVMTDGLKITIDGTEIPMERISLSADKCTAAVAAPANGWEYGAALSVAAEAKDYFGMAAESVSGIVPVEEEPTYTYVGKTALIGLQDFGDSYNSADWMYAFWKATGGVLTGQQLGVGATKQIVAYPEVLKTAMANRQPYQLLIRSKMRLDSAKAEAGNSLLELALGIDQDYGACRRLARLYGSETGGIALKYGTESSLTSTGDSVPNATGKNVALGQWVDIEILIDANGDGTGTVTYVVDGAVQAQDVPISGLEKAENVRIQVQNYANASIDDFEAYAVIGGTLKFECLAVEPSGNVGTQDAITLKFSNDFAVEQWKNGGILINGEEVSSERITAGTEIRSLAIAASEEGWDTQKNYSVSFGKAAARDIHGTPVEMPEGGLSFKTGGDSVTAKIAEIIADGTNISAKALVRNVSDQDINIYVIAAEYGKIGGVQKIENITMIPQTISSEDQWAEIPADITMHAADNQLKLMVWYQDSLIPILKTPVEYPQK